MAAITRFNGKGKVPDLHFAALTSATRAADVRCAPLTADSDLVAIAEACRALAPALGELHHVQMNKTDKDKRKALQGELAYPSPQLKEAFKAHLRAEAAQQAGGEATEAAQATEAVVAARRIEVARLVIKPTEATGVDACVKAKPFFRHIRAVYPNEWAATAGDELAKANAAIDCPSSTVPPSVVEKWQAALHAAHGPTCVFKNRTRSNSCSGWSIKGLHIYQFVLAGAGAPAPADDAGIGPLPPLAPAVLAPHAQRV